jgi:hypothetical protein
MELKEKGSSKSMQDDNYNNKLKIVSDGDGLDPYSELVSYSNKATARLIFNKPFLNNNNITPPNHL